MNAKESESPGAVKTAVTQVASRRVVWDRLCLGDDTPAAALFDAEAWRVAGRIDGRAKGRGEANFITTDDGARWVLRHYRRGGVVAYFNADRYFGRAGPVSRPMREFGILAELHRRGLAVPRPIAAQAVRSAGPTYRADLITERLVGTRALADRLAESNLAAPGWHALGAAIAHLHRAGVWHADLNARNVLVDETDAGFHIIDFDRARFRGDGTWREANLKRFRRSLDKFAATGPMFHFAEADWRALVDGYGAVFSDLRGL